MPAAYHTKNSFWEGLPCVREAFARRSPCSASVRRGYVHRTSRSWRKPPLRPRSTSRKRKLPPRTTPQPPKNTHQHHTDATRRTAGAVADYANDKPPKDATMVAKLRAAGAIILGKTNLDEYAPAGIGRSTLGGQTCNPYDTRRTTGGSSAGSAAAVAANLAICGLGTDTSGSVRYPSSLNALVGIVATQGLVSRAGIVPLTFSRDRGGPMCRTVEDTAAVLEVLTGDDPRDAITAGAHGRQPIVYSNYTGRHSPAGKRLGVVRG